ncbi:transcription termination factor Rho [Amnibacterium setariae]|uniref:Transcription termination factor Rho n=2 Tax=Amnibacterium setariae TaxID=2306585 RepID=A0A3A1U537_9MICO|nr:transcription termination factor Rho [Amnibacterium setariae]
MRVDDLRRLAVSLGIGNTSTMRKGSLVDAIDEQYENQTDTAAPDADVQDGEQQQAEEHAPSAEAPHDPNPEGLQPQPEEAAETVTAAEDAVDEAEGGAEAPDAAEPAVEQAPAEAEQPAAEQAPAEEPAADSGVTQVEPVEPQTEAEQPATDAEQDAGSTDSDAPRSAASHVNAGLTGIAEDLQALQAREQAERDAAGGEPEEQPAEGERTGGRRGRGRGRGRGQNARQNADQQQQAEGDAQQQPKAEPQQAKAEAPAKQEPKQDQAQQNGQQQNGQQQRQQAAEDGEGRRGRYRDRKRRGQGNEWDEPEIRDDDVLIPIAGILDVLDNYAFVRTSGYLSGANDVYVSLGQVKKYNLRRGDAVVGAIRQIPESEQPSRQKYNALVKVDSINGLPVAEAEGRLEFDALTPLYPAERLRLETEAGKLTARVIDLVAPLGKGQRGLVVAPPKAGTTLLLQAVANAITKNNPEVHLMVVLVDERPEDVTEMQRTVKGEVIASTFDRPAEDHTTVADLAVERAKRLVELGYDVVILLDSITRLGRAFNQTAHQSGRQVGGGIDAAALLPAKQFFGAARNIENGGSLTILASAHVETGSAADEAILAEFTGAANAEIVLSGALADKRIFPAIDITRSGTRREEILMGPDEVKVTWQLRRAIAGHTPQEALDVVTSKLRETGTNVEFLVQMQKSLPSTK